MEFYLGRLQLLAKPRPAHRLDDSHREQRWVVRLHRARKRPHGKLLQGALFGLPDTTQAYNIYSTFVFSSCATSLTLDPSDGLAGGIKGLMTAGACWTACAGFLNAYLEGTSGSTFNCFCGNNAPTTSGVGPSCGQSSFYMYSHTPAQAASGLARRKQRLLEINAERVLADNPYCPVGLESCRVFPDLRDEAYECIRTDSELESCGGCRYGRHGPAFTNMTTASGVE